MKPTAHPCPVCGAPLPDDAPRGLCPKCLLAPRQARDRPTRQPRVPTAPHQDDSAATERGFPASRAFGDYDLLEEIARGGMGVVYRARQRSLGRIVALKTILAGPSARPEDVARFRQEAEAAAHLKHANIVAIHEVGEHDGQHFFSMDYVEGQTLRQLTLEHPLPAQRAAEIVRTIAEAVHYAHTQGVVHRDLKPSNVLLDAAGQPHVTDFGLAKRIGTDGDLTVTHAAMGTPGYMPPEQASGQSKAAGPLADVFALGAMLYDLLTGRPPFRGETPLETMAQTMQTDPIAPRLLNANMARDLETICLKCLEKEPSRRYASALALAQDIARHQNHQPILAQPPSTTYRARKFVRRNRGAVAVAVGFSLLMIAGTLVSTTFGLRAIRAQKKEQTERERATRAEQGANQQAQEALASQAETKAVVEFLREHVLAAARPEGLDGGLGREVTLRRAVEVAVPQIAILFTNQASVEIEVRDALGRTFGHLGDHSNALSQLQRTFELSTSRFGRQHSNTVVAGAVLASTYTAAGRAAEAVTLLTKTMADARTGLPPDHPCLVSAKMVLGQAYMEAGALSNGVTMLEEVLEWYRGHLGEATDPPVEAMTRLGTAYAKIGRGQEAVRLLKTAYESRVTALGEGNVKTIVPALHLAGAYQQVGQIPEAFRLLDQALRTSRALFGHDHPATLKILERTGLIHMQAREPARAVPWFKEALDLRQARYGADDTDTLSLLNNLASAYQATRRQAEALPLQERALAVSRAKRGAEHPSTVIYMHNLAVTHEDLGHLSQAIPLYEAALALQTNQWGVNTNQITGSMQHLAEAYLKANRPADAEALYRNLLQIRRQTPPADSRKLAQTLSELGESLMRQGKFTDAEPFLREYLDFNETNYPGHSPAFAAQGLLGRALLGQEKYADAEALLLKAHAGLTRREAEQSSQPRAQFLEETTERLVQLYEAWGRPGEAAKWREKRR